MVFTQASRKHRIAKGRAIEVMASTDPVEGVRCTGDPILTWIGPDSRGLILEIVGIVVPDRDTGEDILLILHVMPEYPSEE